MDWHFKEMLKLKEVPRRMRFISGMDRRLACGNQSIGIVLDSKETLLKRDLEK